MEIVRRKKKMYEKTEDKNKLKNETVNIQWNSREKSLQEKVYKNTKMKI